MPAAPRASKKQPKAVASTSKAAYASDEQQNTSNRNRHGDLLVNMKPLSVQVDRLFTKAGVSSVQLHTTNQIAKSTTYYCFHFSGQQLPRNYLTSIIQRDWHKHIKDKADTKTNSSLKGIGKHSNVNSFCTIFIAIWPLYFQITFHTNRCTWRKWLVSRTQCTKPNAKTIYELV